MTKRFLTALMLVFCLATLIAAPAGATTDGKTKLSATLLDKKVKVNAKARIKGELETDAPDGRTLTPIYVQRLEAGVWVNVLTADCRPNYTFRLNVSFSIAAEYQLRVYHPTTTVYSSTMLLTVF